MPRHEQSFVALKTFEPRGKGLFNQKCIETEQMCTTGMNCMRKFKEVTKALLGTHPSDSEHHHQLKRETKKWEDMVAALSIVQCFFKSQKKSDPDECNGKLFALWKA